MHTRPLVHRIHGFIRSYQCHLVDQQDSWNTRHSVSGSRKSPRNVSQSLINAQPAHLSPSLSPSDASVPALVMQHEGISKTYGELLSDANKLANALTQLGFKKGDIAGCWSANVYQYVVVYWALSSIGVINCSLSPFYKAPEMEYALTKGDFKGLFLPSTGSLQSPVAGYHSVAGEINWKKCDKLQHLIYMDGTVDEQPRYGDIHTTSIDVLSSTSETTTPNAFSGVHADDYHCLYLTSGTTGKPKLAALGHFGIYNNAKILQVYKKGWKVDETHHNVCLTIPFFHAYAGVLGLGSMAVVPVTYTVPSFRYTSSATLSTIASHKCTEWWSVPTMLFDLVAHRKTEEGRAYDASSLRTIVVGADIVPPSLTRECLKCFPNLTDLFVGYGATESHGLMTHTRKEDTLEMKTSTCGTAADFTQVKVIDNGSGLPVPHGDKGELLIRGHNVLKCYWNDAEKTAEAVTNGWYRTGDQATMTPDGYINIVGRLKEMLIRGGLNIFPREIEDVLMSHDRVIAAAVCGIPNERLGQEVVAWVKVNGDATTMSEEDIINYCKSKLASYKTPTHVFLVDTFPMTASGKVQKFEMTRMTLEWLERRQEKKKK